MSDQSEKAIRRILKCLTLAKNAGAAPQEAENAMRQAQKLMQQYQISESQIKAAEAREHLTKAGATTKPAAWETGLAIQCGKAFACQTLFVSQRKITENLNFVTTGFWNFVGMGVYPVAAAYAFDVLLRQAKKSRQDYIKTKLKRYNPTNRIKHADMFCEGWVQTAVGKLSKLTLSQSEQEAVDALMNSKKTQTLKTVQRNKGKIGHTGAGHFYSGREKGHDAQLNNAINGGHSTKLLN